MAFAIRSYFKVCVCVSGMGEDLRRSEQREQFPWGWSEVGR